MRPIARRGDDRQFVHIYGRNYYLVEITFVHTSSKGDVYLNLPVEVDLLAALHCRSTGTTFFVLATILHHVIDHHHPSYRLFMSSTLLSTFHLCFFSLVSSTWGLIRPFTACTHHRCRPLLPFPLKHPCRQPILQQV